MSHKTTRAACAIALALEAVAPGLGAPAHAQMGDPTVEVVASGLDVPWSMAFAPDGRLFVAERPGRIRVIDETGLLDDPWASIDVARVPGSEAGLMGLAIDPDFGNTGHVFACYSFLAPPDRILNRVVRFREVDGRGVDEEVLVDDIPGGRYHNGCRLGFGPDGMLYATTGDATEEDLAQDPGSLAGKVLRMSTDGSVPADNPFEGSLVWSLGHRNSQGIAWRPSTGALWSTEHGTTGYNEVNHIVRGGNYGWPFIRVGEQDDRFVEPAVGMNEIPPAGAAFISGGRYDGMDDRLVFTVLGSGGLQVAMIVGNEEVAGHGELIDDRFGRLRDVVLGPDGYLYISTSNRDQLGDPGPDDDRILRIISF